MLLEDDNASSAQIEAPAWEHNMHDGGRTNLRKKIEGGARLRWHPPPKKAGTLVKPLDYTGPANV